VNIGGRIRTARRAAGLSQEEVARRAGLSLKGMGEIERGDIEDPHISSLTRIARALGVSVGTLLKEEEPALAGKAEAPPWRWSERVGVSEEDVQRAFLEAERLRETARPRVEEALASIAGAHASVAETQASYREQVAEVNASVAEAEASVAEARASYRELVAHLQEVRQVMEQVYGTELELEWAYVKAMMEEGSSEGPQARRLRSASRKMVLFYEELVGLIEDAGVQVKRKDEGEAVEEPEASARPEALELTVH
jgi:transcriptional regulator with XRE-family HTH domain